MVQSGRRSRQGAVAGVASVAPYKGGATLRYSATAGTPRSNCYGTATETLHATAFEALAEAQQRLSRLLMAEDRDPPAIAEAADAVRRLERQAVEAERGRGRDETSGPAASPSDGDEQRRIMFSARPINQ